MQNAAQAYGAVAKQIANPRELEADLLLKAASQLQAVYDGWDRKRSDLDLALRYNRKLWTIFLASVTNSAHGLPVEIRQNVAIARHVRHEPDRRDAERSQARKPAFADQYQSRIGRRVCSAAPSADHSDRAPSIVMPGIARRRRA